MSGPTSTPSSVPSPTVSAPIRSAKRAANSSATEAWTRNRLAEVQASPMLRILASIAPSTAASRSASPKTMKGALPPSSIETRSSCSEAWATSTLPTAVEPVKVSLRSRASRMIGSHTPPESVVVTTLSTPGGSPTSSISAASASMVSGRLVGGLDHHRAAGRDGGADLAGAHREGEVPGRDHQRGPDGCLHRDQPGAAGRGGGVAAVDADRLLGEPAEELGAVGHLALRLGERLAHLERHQPGEVVGPLGEQLEGAAQDLAALRGARWRPTPSGRPPRRPGRARRRRGCRRRCG